MVTGIAQICRVWIADGRLAGPKRFFIGVRLVLICAGIVDDVSTIVSP